jgi:hypothetical protein
MVAVFRRRLRPGKTFDDFKEAWEAEKGFGVPSRVFSALSSDGREVLSVGFVAIDSGLFQAAMTQLAPQEAVRHSRIEEVVESSERAFFELLTEHDLSVVPHEIDLGSADSLLRPLSQSGHEA